MKGFLATSLQTVTCGVSAGMVGPAGSLRERAGPGVCRQLPGSGVWKTETSLVSVSTLRWTDTGLCASQKDGQGTHGGALLSGSHV